MYMQLTSNVSVNINTAVLKAFKAQAEAAAKKKNKNKKPMPQTLEEFQRMRLESKKKGAVCKRTYCPVFDVLFMVWKCTVCRLCNRFIR